MGALGVYGGPGGAIVSIMYGVIDLFYPGGWIQAMIDQDRIYQDNKSINPDWTMWTPGKI